MNKQPLHNMQSVILYIKTVGIAMKCGLIQSVELDFE